MITINRNYYFYANNDSKTFKHLLLILKNTNLIMTQVEELKAVSDSLSTKVDTLQLAIDTDQASDAQVVSNLKDQITVLEAAASASATDPMVIQGVIDSMNATISKIEASTTDVAGPDA